MYSHRGLPHNLPSRKTKAKIFSTSPSPSKRTESITVGDSAELQSLLKTPQKRSLSSQSQHKIVLKQKPIHLNPLLKKGEKRNIDQITNGRDLNNQQHIESQKQKPKFVNTILNMMGGLITGSKFSTNETYKNDLHKQCVEGKQKQNKHQVQTTKQKNIFGPQLVQTNSKIRPIGKTTEQKQLQLLQHYTKMLEDKSCWVSYNGGVAEGLREGYGILFFQNKDKFMGGFKKDKAHGHGTFYAFSIGKRMMSKWQNNEVKIQQGYLIEQL